MKLLDRVATIPWLRTSLSIFYAGSSISELENLVERIHLEGIHLFLFMGTPGNLPCAEIAACCALAALLSPRQGFQPSCEQNQKCFRLGHGRFPEVPFTAFAFLNMIIGIVVNVLEAEHARERIAQAEAAGEPTLSDLRQEIRELKQMIRQR